MALVTGATNGIGQATAVKLAAEGAIVGVNQRPSGDPGETLRRIKEVGGEGFPVVADMSDPEAVAAMVQEVARRGGRLDHVVSNAAVNPLMKWDEPPLAEFDRLFATNVRGTWVVCTKGAISMLGKALGSVLGELGTRVNVVEPGAVRTNMSASIFDAPEVLKYYLDRIPLHRVGEPSELADVIAFLLSDAASYVTSATLLVDAGFIVNAEI